MSEDPSSWAIVLAGGEGSRLWSMTTDASGTPVPKQFCSLRGGRTLLADALARAARVVPRKRIVVVVAEEHRPFWARELQGHAPENLVVQPRNRGTAAGVLLPLLHVLERDAEARVVLLPSDHHVQREHVIGTSLRLALDSLDGGVTLLGIPPDSPETGYGWIVPARSRSLLRPVERFVEKPGAAQSRELLACGGVWNSFLLAAEGRALARLYELRLPELAARFRAAFAAPRAERVRRLAALYDELETRDFSRHVLEGSERHLRLELVPPCGWTDLGTPERVTACLAALGRQDLRPAERPARDAGRIDLAVQAALHGSRETAARESRRALAIAAQPTLA